MNPEKRFSPYGIASVGPESSEEGSGVEEKGNGCCAIQETEKGAGPRTAFPMHRGK